MCFTVVLTARFTIKIAFTASFDTKLGFYDFQMISVKPCFVLDMWCIQIILLNLAFYALS